MQDQFKHKTVPQKCTTETRLLMSYYFGRTQHSVHKAKSVQYAITPVLFKRYEDKNNRYWEGERKCKVYGRREKIWEHKLWTEIRRGEMRVLQEQKRGDED
ncbi:hypothetical protein KM043_016111 [Ampulex compressa]|nr:hypothetical protein KM043_016111 [Ampulex compressa]